MGKWMTRIFALVLSVMLLPANVWADNERVIAVGSLPSLDNFTADFTGFTATSQNEQAQAGALAVKLFLSQDCVKAAFDTTRPFGLVAWVGDDVCSPKGLFAIPIVNIDKVRELVKTSVEMETVDDTTVLVTHGDQKIFVRQIGSWLVCADSLTCYSDALDYAAIEKQILEEAAKRDFGLTLYINQIPAKDRQEVVMQVVGNIRDFLDANRERCSGVLFDAAKQGLAKFEEQAKANGYLCPVDRLCLNMNWNHDRNSVQISLEANAPKFSDAALAMNRAATPSVSELAGFRCPGALVSGATNARIPGLRDQVFKAAFDESIAQLKNQVQKKAAPEHVETIQKFIDASAPVWYELCYNPNVDRAANLFVQEDKILFTGARLVEDGYVLEKQLKDVIGFLGENYKDKAEGRFIERSFEEVGDLHVYSAKVKLDADCKCPCPQAKEVVDFFGDSVAVCLVFAPKTVYAAIGTDAKDALLASIDKTTSGEMPVAQLNVNLVRLLWVFAQKESDEGRKAEMLAAYEQLKDGEATATLTFLPTETGCKLELELTSSTISMLRIFK